MHCLGSPMSTTAVCATYRPAGNGSPAAGVSRAASRAELWSPRLGSPIPGQRYAPDMHPANISTCELYPSSVQRMLCFLGGCPYCPILMVGGSAYRPGHLYQALRGLGPLCFLSMLRLRARWSAPDPHTPGITGDSA